MEEQPIYKDEYLIETAKMVEQLLNERGCELVAIGQFIGNQLKCEITIQKIKTNESNN
jgi:hypothetical protein